MVRLRRVACLVVAYLWTVVNSFQLLCSIVAGVTGARVVG